MNLERIDAIDKTGSLFVDNGEREDGHALEELCRLARLGLRVEGAVEVTVPWSFTDIWYVTDIGDATPDQLAAATMVIVRVASKP